MKTLIENIEGNNSDGKNVLLIAGMHGNEITPVYALANMIKNNSFNLNKIKSLTILNGINMSGLRYRERDIIDEPTNDLNRLLIPFKDYNEVDLLSKKIKENDIIIDIHSSPNCMEFALIDIDEYTNSMKKWCDESNIQTAFRYSKANTLKRYGLEKGKPTLTIEINGIDKIDKISADNVKHIINKLLQNIELAKINKSTPHVLSLIEVKTYLEGILVEEKHNAQLLVKSDILAKVYDLQMNEIGKIKSPVKGIIICSPDKSFITRGDVVYLIQENND